MKNSKFKIGLRTIALATCFIFTVTSVYLPSPAEAVETIGAMPAGISEKLLQIPTKYGQITDLSFGKKNAPVFIHLQSAHAQVEAEKNLENILSYLKKHTDLNLIFLEGAAEKLQPELFNLFPKHPGFNQHITDKYIEEGYLTGPEGFLINQTQYGVQRTAYGEKTGNESSVLRTPYSSLEGFGVEDLSAYKANRDAFLELHDNKAKIEAELGKLKLEIEKAADPVVSKPLREFLRREQNYHDGLIPLEAMLRSLSEDAAQTLELDLSDALHQVKWPALIRYYRLQEISKELDQAKITEEKAEFLKELDALKISKDLQKEITWILNAKPAELLELKNKQAFGDTKYSLIRFAFDRFYTELSQEYTFEKYPTLKLYIQHLVFMDEIESKGLFAETKRLSEKIGNALAKTAEEKEILQKYRDFRLLQKLFKLELTRSEYDSLVRGTVYGVQRNKNSVLRTPYSVQKLYDSALKFYEVAIEREEHMFQNAIQKMREQKAKRAVIVTGGFHAEGLKELIAEKGYSYLQISPRINKLSKDADQIYLRNILGPEKIATSHYQPTLVAAPVTYAKVMGRKALGLIRNAMRKLAADEITTVPDLNLQDALRDELRKSASSVEGLGDSEKLNAKHYPLAAKKVRSEMRPKAIASGTSKNLGTGRSEMREPLFVERDGQLFLRIKEIKRQYDHVGERGFSNFIKNALGIPSRLKGYILEIYEDKKVAEAHQHASLNRLPAIVEYGTGILDESGKEAKIARFFARRSSGEYSIHNVKSSIEKLLEAGLRKNGDEVAEVTITPVFRVMERDAFEITIKGWMHRIRDKQQALDLISFLSDYDSEEVEQFEAAEFIAPAETTTETQETQYQPGPDTIPYIFKLFQEWEEDPRLRVAFQGHPLTQRIWEWLIQTPEEVLGYLKEAETSDSQTIRSTVNYLMKKYRAHQRNPEGAVAAAEKPYDPITSVDANTLKKRKAKKVAELEKLLAQAVAVEDYDAIDRLEPAIEALKKSRSEARSAGSGQARISLVDLGGNGVLVKLEDVEMEWKFQDFVYLGDTLRRLGVQSRASFDRGNVLEIYDDHRVFEAHAHAPENRQGAIARYGEEVADPAKMKSFHFYELMESGSKQLELAALLQERINQNKTISVEGVQVEGDGDFRAVTIRFESLAFHVEPSEDGTLRSPLSVYDDTIFDDFVKVQVEGLVANHNNSKNSQVRSDVRNWASNLMIGSYILFVLDMAISFVLHKHLGDALLNSKIVDPATINIFWGNYLPYGADISMLAVLGVSFRLFSLLFGFTALSYRLGDYDSRFYPFVKALGGTHLPERIMTGTYLVAAPLMILTSQHVFLTESHISLLAESVLCVVMMGAIGVLLHAVYGALHIGKYVWSLANKPSRASTTSGTTQAETTSRSEMRQRDTYRDKNFEKVRALIHRLETSPTEEGREKIARELIELPSPYTRIYGFLVLEDFDEVIREEDIVGRLAYMLQHPSTAGWIKELASEAIQWIEDFSSDDVHNASLIRKGLEYEKSQSAKAAMEDAARHILDSRRSEARGPQEVRDQDGSPVADGIEIPEVEGLIFQPKEETTRDLFIREFIGSYINGLFGAVAIGAGSGLWLVISEAVLSTYSWPSLRSTLIGTLMGGFVGALLLIVYSVIDAAVIVRRDELEHKAFKKYLADFRSAPTGTDTKRSEARQSQVRVFDSNNTAPFEAELKGFIESPETNGLGRKGVFWVSVEPFGGKPRQVLERYRIVGEEYKSAGTEEGTFEIVKPGVKVDIPVEETAAHVIRLLKERIDGTEKLYFSVTVGGMLEINKFHPGWVERSEARERFDALMEKTKFGKMDSAVEIVKSEMPRVRPIEAPILGVAYFWTGDIQRVRKIYNRLVEDNYIHQFETSILTLAVILSGDYEAVRTMRRKIANKYQSAEETSLAILTFANFLFDVNSVYHEMLNRHSSLSNEALALMVLLRGLTGSEQAMQPHIQKAKRRWFKRWPYMAFLDYFMDDPEYRTELFNERSFFRPGAWLRAAVVFADEKQPLMAQKQIMQKSRSVPTGTDTRRSEARKPNQQQDDFASIFLPPYSFPEISSFVAVAAVITLGLLLLSRPVRIPTARSDTSDEEAATVPEQIASENWTPQSNERLPVIIDASGRDESTGEPLPEVLPEPTPEPQPVTASASTSSQSSQSSMEDTQTSGSGASSSVSSSSARNTDSSETSAPGFSDVPWNRAKYSDVPWNPGVPLFLVDAIQDILLMNTRPGSNSLQRTIQMEANFESTLSYFETNLKSNYMVKGNGKDYLNTWYLIPDYFVIYFREEPFKIYRLEVSSTTIRDLAFAIASIVFSEPQLQRDLRANENTSIGVIYRQGSAHDAQWKRRGLSVTAQPSSSIISINSRSEMRGSDLLSNDGADLAKELIQSFGVEEIVRETVVSPLVVFTGWVVAGAIVGAMATFVFEKTSSKMKAFYTSLMAGPCIGALVVLSQGLQSMSRSADKVDEMSSVSSSMGTLEFFINLALMPFAVVIAAIMVKVWIDTKKKEPAAQSSQASSRYSDTQDLPPSNRSEMRPKANASGTSKNLRTGRSEMRAWRPVLENPPVSIWDKTEEPFNQAVSVDRIDLSTLNPGDLVSFASGLYHWYLIRIEENREFSIWKNPHLHRLQPGGGWCFRTPITSLSSLGIRPPTTLERILEKINLRREFKRWRSSPGILSVEEQFLAPHFSDETKSGSASPMAEAMREVPMDYPHNIAVLRMSPDDFDDDETLEDWQLPQNRSEARAGAKEGSIEEKVVATIAITAIVFLLSLLFAKFLERGTKDALHPPFGTQNPTRAQREEQRFLEDEKLRNRMDDSMDDPFIDLESEDDFGGFVRSEARSIEEAIALVRERLAAEEWEAAYDILVEFATKPEELDQVIRGQKWEALKSLILFVARSVRTRTVFPEDSAPILYSAIQAGMVSIEEKPLVDEVSQVAIASGSIEYANDLISAWARKFPVGGGSAISEKSRSETRDDETTRELQAADRAWRGAVDGGRELPMEFRFSEGRLNTLSRLKARRDQAHERWAHDHPLKRNRSEVRKTTRRDFMKVAAFGTAAAVLGLVAAGCEKGGSGSDNGAASGEALDSLRGEYESVAADSISAMNRFVLRVIEALGMEMYGGGLMGFSRYYTNSSAGGWRTTQTFDDMVEELRSGNESSWVRRSEIRSDAALRALIHEAESEKRKLDEWLAQFKKEFAAPTVVDQIVEKADETYRFFRNYRHWLIEDFNERIRTATSPANRELPSQVWTMEKPRLTIGDKPFEKQEEMVWAFQGFLDEGIESIEELIVARARVVRDFKSRSEMRPAPRRMRGSPEPNVVHGRPIAKTTMLVSMVGLLSAGCGIHKQAQTSELEEIEGLEAIEDIKEFRANLNVLSVPQLLNDLRESLVSDSLSPELLRIYIAQLSFNILGSEPQHVAAGIRAEEDWILEDQEKSIPELRNKILALMDELEDYWLTLNTPEGPLSADSKTQAIFGRDHTTESLRNALEALARKLEGRSEIRPTPKRIAKTTMLVLMAGLLSAGCATSREKILFEAWPDGEPREGGAYIELPDGSRPEARQTDHGPWTIDHRQEARSEARDSESMTNVADDIQTRATKRAEFAKARAKAAVQLQKVLKKPAGERDWAWFDRLQESVLRDAAAVTLLETYSRLLKEGINDFYRADGAIPLVHYFSKWNYEPGLKLMTRELQRFAQEESSEALKVPSQNVTTYEVYFHELLEAVGSARYAAALPWIEEMRASKQWDAVAQGSLLKAWASILGEEAVPEMKRLIENYDWFGKLIERNDAIRALGKTGSVKAVRYLKGWLSVVLRTQAYGFWPDQAVVDAVIELNPSTLRRDLKTLRPMMKRKGGVAEQTIDKKLQELERQDSVKSVVRSEARLDEDDPFLKDGDDSGFQPAIKAGGFEDHIGAMVRDARVHGNGFYDMIDRRLERSRQRPHARSEARKTADGVVEAMEQSLSDISAYDWSQIEGWAFDFVDEVVTPFINVRVISKHDAEGIARVRQALQEKVAEFEAMLTDLKESDLEGQQNALSYDEPGDEEKIDELRAQIEMREVLPRALEPLKGALARFDLEFPLEFSIEDSSDALSGTRNRDAGVAEPKGITVSALLEQQEIDAAREDFRSGLDVDDQEIAHLNKLLEQLKAKEKVYPNPKKSRILNARIEAIEAKIQEIRSDGSVRSETRKVTLKQYAENPHPKAKYKAIVMGEGQEAVTLLFLPSEDGFISRRTVKGILGELTLSPYIAVETLANDWHVHYLMTNPGVDVWSLQTFDSEDPQTRRPVEEFVFAADAKTGFYLHDFPKLPPRAEAEAILTEEERETIRQALEGVSNEPSYDQETRSLAKWTLNGMPFVTDKGLGRALESLDSQLPAYRYPSDGSEPERLPKPFSPVQPILKKLITLERQPASVARSESRDRDLTTVEGIRDLVSQDYRVGQYKKAVLAAVKPGDILMEGVKKIIAKIEEDNSLDQTSVDHMERTMSQLSWSGRMRQEEAIDDAIRDMRVGRELHEALKALISRSEARTQNRSQVSESRITKSEDPSTNASAGKRGPGSEDQLTKQDSGITLTASDIFGNVEGVFANAENLLDRVFAPFIIQSAYAAEVNAVINPEVTKTPLQVALREEIQRLLATLSNVDNSGVSVGVALPVAGESFDAKTLLSALNANPSLVNELAFSGRLPGSIQSQLRDRDLHVRQMELDKPFMPVNKQAAVPVAMAQNAASDVMAEIFYPVDAEMDGVARSEARKYVEVLKLVAAVHVADIVSKTPKLLKEAELLKAALLGRLNLLEDSVFQKMIQAAASGRGLTIQGVMAEKYLEMKAAEAVSRAA